MLHIHAERETKGEFPDHGSSAEIYTNPDPNKYVELEMLGPMQQMSKGSVISRRQTYRLVRRTNQSLAEQVQDLLNGLRD